MLLLVLLVLVVLVVLVSSCGEKDVLLSQALCTHHLVHSSDTLSGQIGQAVQRAW